MIVSRIWAHNLHVIASRAALPVSIRQWLPGRVGSETDRMSSLALLSHATFCHPPHSAWSIRQRQDTVMKGRKMAFEP
jgi:hypothetical protein